MKIIAGKFKNRTIPTVKSSDYRPSTSMLKEAIFSMLSSGNYVDKKPLNGAKILDLFAGTGALGFESLSRGADFVRFVDINQDHLSAAKNFAEKIGAESEVSFLCASATRLPLADRKYDIIFIDPPYFKKLIFSSLESLQKNNYLTKGVIIVLEMEKEHREPDLSKYNLSIVKDKIYGKTRLIIAEYFA